MDEISILGGPQATETTIVLGGSLGRIAERAGGRNAVLVVDKNVARLHAKLLPDLPRIEIEADEKNKTLTTVGKIYDFLLENRIDRDSHVIAVGGGLVLDVAGFAASTYKRGVRCIYGPTTLLAQADAGIGGKTGVNLHGYKNLVGTFRMPEAIVIDPAVLLTLPKEEVGNGFAEIIKHGAIADASLFDLLEKNAQKAMRLDPQMMRDVLKRSIKVKTTIVQKDERETLGERMLLNFGHTLGHAIEKEGGLAHGMAISIGMVAAANLSRKKAGLKEAEEKRLMSVLEAFGLPTRLPKGVSVEKLMAAMAQDKKRLDGKLAFVMLERIGKAGVEKIDMQELEECIRDLC